MRNGETSQAIAQQWPIEKFRERFGKPLFEGVFHERIAVVDRTTASQDASADPTFSSATSIPLLSGMPVPCVSPPISAQTGGP